MNLQRNAEGFAVSCPRYKALGSCHSHAYKKKKKKAVQMGNLQVLLGASEH